MKHILKKGEQDLTFTGYNEGNINGAYSESECSDKIIMAERGRKK